MTLDTPTEPYVNIAAYKFVPLDDLPARRVALRRFCESLDLKGTILLSPEGINLFLSGTAQNIDRFVDHLHGMPEFSDLEVKKSPGEHQPFRRMLVRLKKEIITMGVDGIDPARNPSPKISAQQLAEWYRQGKAFHVLDTRNDYEVEVGTFQNAVDLGIESFRQFPDAIRRLPEQWKQEPVVMFCTGGIRCEKAGPLMQREGFEQVFQLDGGILKYFEACHGEFYNGDCFVFDKRVAVNPELNETEAGLCYACQAVLTTEDQQHPHYYPPHCCPHCYQSPEQLMQEQLRKREEEIRRVTHPLPGSIPYVNNRPVDVAERFDQMPLIEVLCLQHPHVSRDHWLDELNAGRFRFNDQILGAEHPVRAGWRIAHLFPDTVEPDVNAAIEMLYEDEHLLALNKPAPLPMHPCGRFNRNSLVWILDQVYAPNRVRLLHRLDANTTGVVVLARTKQAARMIQPQFAAGNVAKTYLALVEGRPETRHFSSDLSIGRSATVAGGRYADVESGLTCRTEFRLLKTDGQRSLIECRPITGRTNQIRIHLASLGFPIVGDTLYGVASGEKEVGCDADFDEPTQTLGLNAPPLCLHSYRLELKHPETGAGLCWVASPPEWANGWLG
jgi:RluA family pseudouridine synthase